MITRTSAGLGVDSLRIGLVHHLFMSGSWIVLYYFQGSWGRRGLLLRLLLEIIKVPKLIRPTCPSGSCAYLLELCDEFLGSFSAFVDTIWHTPPCFAGQCCHISRGINSGGMEFIYLDNYLQLQKTAHYLSQL